MKGLYIIVVIITVSTLLLPACGSHDAPCDQLKLKPGGEILKQIEMEEYIYCSGKYFSDSYLYITKGTHINHDSSLIKLYHDTAKAMCLKAMYKIDFSIHSILISPSRGYNYNHHNLIVGFYHDQKKVVFEDGMVQCSSDGGSDYLSTSPNVMAVVVPAIPRDYTIEYDFYTIDGE